MADVLVIGAGPAGLAIAAELCDRGLQVTGLAPQAPSTLWVNTYGIWTDELEALGHSELLAHSWDNTVHELNDRYFRTQSCVDGTELQTDGARANNRKLLRYLWKF